MKIYTTEEIAEISKPILKKYHIPKVYVFGSYARGDAKEDSDIDFFVTFPKRFSLLKLSGLAFELENTFHKEIDIVDEETLLEQLNDHSNSKLHFVRNRFYDTIMKEGILLYD